MMVDPIGKQMTDEELVSEIIEMCRVTPPLGGVLIQAASCKALISEISSLNAELEAARKVVEDARFYSQYKIIPLEGTAPDIEASLEAYDRATGRVE